MASLFADSSGTQLDNKEWPQLLVSAPVPSFGYTSDQGGMLSEPQTDLDSVTFRMSAIYENEVWSTYEWNNAPCRIFYGELGQPWSSYTQLLEGTTSGLTRDGGVTASLTLRSLDNTIDKPLLDAKYAGNGGAEGPASGSGKGKLKPIAIGNCKSIDPVVVDAAKWIFQVHSGPVQDIVAIYDMALPLPAPTASVSTYAELEALALQPGQWAKCKAAGCFRLGGSTNKRVTADVLGALDEGVYVSTIDLIIPYLLKKCGYAGASQVGAMRPFAGKGWSFYSTGEADIGAVARKAAYDGGGIIFLDQSGKWQSMSAFDVKAPITLSDAATSAPSILSITEANAADPTWKVEVGYAPCWGVHTNEQISPKALELAEEQAQRDADLDAAVEQFDTIRTAANYAKSRVDNMSANESLDRTEKAQLARDRRQIQSSFDALNAKYAALGNPANATTARNTATTKMTALNSYLDGLTPSVTDLATDTTIDRATFNTNLYDAIDAVSNFAAAISGQPGVSAYTFLLSNETHTVPAQSNGTVISYTGAATTLKVLQGATDVTSGFTMSIPTGGNPQALTYTGTYPTYTITGGFDAGEETASLTFRVTGSGAHAGVVIDKTMTFSKSKAGAAGSTGASPPLLTLTSDKDFAKYDQLGTYVGGAITFTAVRQNIPGTNTFFRIYRVSDGTLLDADTSDGFGARAGGLYASSGGDKFVIIGSHVANLILAHGTFRIEAYRDGYTVTDSVAIAKVQDGASIESYSISAYGAGASLPTGFAFGLRSPDLAVNPGLSRGFAVGYRTAYQSWLFRFFDVIGNGAVQVQAGGASTNNGAAMVSWINSIPSGAIVAVYSHDEPQGNLFQTAGLADALYGLGASKRVLNTGNIQYRGAYTLVGVKGWGEGRGFEQYAGAISNDPRAYVTSSFSVVNGVPQSAVPGPSAPSGLTLIPRTAGTKVNADSVFMTDQYTGWGAGHARSKESYVGAVAAEWIIPPDAAGACNTMAGLSSHPDTTATGATSYSYETVEFAIHRNDAGSIGIFVDGASMTTYRVGPTPTFTTDICRVEYDGIQTVSFYVNNVLAWRHNRESKVPLFFTAALASTSPSLTNIKFTPIGKAADPALPLVVRSPALGAHPNARLTWDGKSIKKWSGGNTWDCDAYSAISYTGGAQASFKSTSPNGGIHAMMVGLNTDPTTDRSYGSIDYSWYLQGDGYATIYLNDQQYAPSVGGVGPGYGAGQFSVRYDGRSKVDFLYQGVVRYTVPAPAGLTLYMDSSFLTEFGEITDVSFTGVGTSAEDALTMYLTNEAHVLPADSSGNVTSYSGSDTSIVVMSGSTDVTNQFEQVTADNPQALSIPGTYPNYYIQGGFDASEPVATVTFKAKGKAGTPWAGKQLSSVYSLTKSKAGASGGTGSAAPLIQVTATPQALRYDKNDAYVAGDVVFQATYQNAAGPVAWYSVVGHQIAGAPGVTISGDTLTINAARMASVINYNISQGYPANETIIASVSGISDRITVVKVKDGQDGAAGQSALVAGPSLSNVELTGDVNGVPVGGELPRSISNGATVNGVAVPITSITGVTTSNCTVAVVGSAIRIDAVSARTASVSYTINASGQSATASISIATSKAAAPPPSSTGGTVTFSNLVLSATSMTQISPTITLNSGSKTGGTVDWGIDWRTGITAGEGSTSTAGVQAQMYYRVANGTFTAFGSTYSGSAFRSEYENEPGNIYPGTYAIPSLAQNTAYEFALFARKSAGNKNASGLGGQVTVTLA